MTFTATQIALPANVTVPTGHYARFNALGRFMRVDERLIDGLGTIFKAVGGDRFERVHF